MDESLILRQITRITPNYTFPFTPLRSVDGCGKQQGFFNIAKIRSQKLCWKLNLKNYTIPLFDIIRCVKRQKQNKNDGFGMLKIHFSRGGKIYVRKSWKNQKRKNVIFFFLNIRQNKNVEYCCY